MSFKKSVIALALLSTTLVSGCALFKTETPEDTVGLKAVSYKDLPGWTSDDQSASVEALKKSCGRIKNRKAETSFGPVAFAGTYADWQKTCAALPETGSADNYRQYFETQFTPYQLIGRDGAKGLFTGYYEPSLAAAADAKSGTPIYAKPDDLISVNLGDFKPELKGQTVLGRVTGDKLVPYYTRAEIEKGALKGKTAEIARAKDPIDVFFLQVQGSGQVVKVDGTVQHVGYAAQNGHAYYAIGQELIKRGAMTKENVSMQSIRAWLEAHPAEAADIMNKNPSYVFFRALDGSGPLGAEGVTLTPGRSLAVDRQKLPYGAPVFLNAEDPDGKAPIQRLMVAQDTGGAIRGTVRGDYFWGPGDAAADKAGRMKSRGEAYILLPKTVVVPDSFKK